MAREITFSKHPNTAEEFQRVRDSSIEDWQKKGPAEIIAATWEISVFSYMLKGQNVLDMVIDRSKIIKQRVPWLD